MRLLVGCFLSAFLAVICNNLYAQLSPSTVQGKVVTEDHAPARAATIILLKSRDSSVVNSTITDKDGFFRFTAIQPGKYLLLVTTVGFNKMYKGPFDVLEGQIAKIPEIILNVSSKLLNPVSVVGTRPEVEARPGKIVLNVQNSISAAGSSVYDKLRQSPGVRVDNSNNISIMGKQNALITIDGKRINLTGDDLVSILRSMQLNTIDRIELITGGSAKYDASGAGVINIISKKGTNLGANGIVSATAGYGKYGKSSAGIVFNDRTDKFNVFGNYNYSYNKYFQTITTDRRIIYNQLVSNYNTDYNNVQNAYSNLFNIGTDYFVSRNHTIGFVVNGSIADYGFVKHNNLKIYNQSVFDSTITANSDVARHISRVNYNLNYKGKLDNAGKNLSADFNYTAYRRSSSEYITNNFYDAGGIAYANPQLFQNLSPSTIRIWLSKVDFIDPLSKTSKLEAGIQYSNVTSDNNLVFGPLKNGQYQSDPMFSNHFIYTENINAAYVNYENSFGKYELTASLRAEETIAKGISVMFGLPNNSNYLDFFPHALLTYKYNNKNDLSLSYSRGIDRPGYEDVNPFLYYMDPYDYRSGNPKLKPQYSNTIELSYSYNKKLVATLYSNIIDGAYHLNFFEQNDATKRNVTIRKNLGTIYNYGVKFFTPFVVANWWSGDFSVDAGYQRYVAYPENGTLNKGTQDILLFTEHKFVISNGLSAEVSGKYESPNFYGISQNKAQFQVDGGLSQLIFNKRGSLRLTATDIFNTLRDRSHTNYQNLDISLIDKKESQVVRLTFTYRFGKNAVKTTTRRTGNEEEQSRTSSSN